MRTTIWVTSMEVLRKVAPHELDEFENSEGKENE